MSDKFFPEEGYEIPVTSKYFKVTEGEHTFRVMSSAIVGYVYFNKENKPVRSRVPFEETPVDMKPEGRINHFWSFVVWNYDTSSKKPAPRLQIFEVTQKTIQTPLKALIDNPKWGSPMTYDITITRKGKGMQDTEYAVMPNPHTEVDAEAKEALEKENINLEALYEGKDPFAKVA